MKKQISLLFAVFLCCSTISWAQNPEESKMKDEFYKTLNSLRQEKKQALDKKDYAKVEQCNWDIIRKQRARGKRRKNLHKFQLLCWKNNILFSYSILY